jgi:predicted negative regulator of RcsB-dependent stress response
MDHYVSDEEQVETIKRWLKANGGAIIGGIIIGVVAVMGWQYWVSYRHNRAEEASLHYNQLSEALRQDKLAQAEQEAQQLLDDFSSSAYAVLAAFKLAKNSLERGDNETAVRHLEWVAEHADLQEFKDIARLRLAQVLLAADRYDEAQNKLNEVENSSFKAEVEELKGDAYLAQNQVEKARTAYQAALGANASNMQVQMKLNNLSIAQDSEG